jgi:hypothetical protein
MRGSLPHPRRKLVQLVQLVLPVLILSIPSVARAWGTKEHLQLTRIAAERLIADESTPPEMKQWLRIATAGLMDMDGERKWFMEERIGIIPRDADGIVFWTVMPDVTIAMEGREEKKVAPFGVPERLLHYIDLELFLSGDAKREYHHDLSGKPKLEDIPRDMKDPRYVQAGMLPFRVEDCYKKLVEQLRAGRLTDANGQHPRDEHAGKWAGYLAHYLEDNTQPQHATIDYKSATYFSDRRKAPNVHAQVEYIMADDENDDHLGLREEYWPLLVKALDSVEDPIKTDDLFKATLEVSLKSYDALPMIGVAAMAATKQGGTPDHPTGEASDKFDTETFFHSRGTYNGREMSLLEMKAYQQAWAVKRVKRLWRRAWDESHKARASQ